jgi:exodeoxyribonuclease VII small subunit
MTTFEEKLKSLETIVEQLSAGEIPLSKSVDLYKQGLTLTKELYGELKTVEQEVKQLTEENGTLTEGTFS